NTLNAIITENTAREDWFKIGGVNDDFFVFDDFLADCAQAKRRFYLGHFCYGVHRHIPGDAVYFTNIRHPVPRLLSGYYGWRKSPDQDVRDYLQDHWEFDNGITKRLCGIGPREPESAVYDFAENLPLNSAPVVNAEMFARAEARMKTEMAFVFVQEIFVESLVLFENRFGLPPLFSFSRAHWNQTEQQTVHRPDPALDAWILAQNPYDLALYEQARETLAAEIAALGEDQQRRIAVRKILDQMLRVPGQSFLASDAIKNAITGGLERLLNANRVRDFLDVICLMAAYPDLPPGFGDILIQWTIKFGSTEDAQRIKAVRAGEVTP
ncbi:MAG: hypothetical protein ACPGO3_15180, partial [Magnetospiraceae bacterium]